MNWFNKFVSNTLGGTGNQLFFTMPDCKPATGRVYYKLFCGGKFEYSLLFSNIIDITYKVEYGSNANFICNEWQILRAAVGICREVSVSCAGEVECFHPLTFGGKPQKTVQPGEFFTSDPITLEAEKGSFLCVEIEFCGTRIPYHLESILPTFVMENGQWVPDKKVPVPGMVGCLRPVRARIGYFGDSITQGIGTPPNAYTHWSALVSEALGEEYSFWNLGIGYGRGQDAATCGAWFYKAKQVDFAVVTFGSNDVGRGRSVEEMKRDFATLVSRLKAAGAKVFLQSLPPFDWQDEYLERWLAINDYIVNELSQEADGFLDVAPLLTTAPVNEGKCKYGKHPDEEGCRLWAEALIPLMKTLISK